VATSSNTQRRLTQTGSLRILDERDIEQIPQPGLNLRLSHAMSFEDLPQSIDGLPSRLSIVPICVVFHHVSSWGPYCLLNGKPGKREQGAPYTEPAQVRLDAMNRRSIKLRGCQIVGKTAAHDHHYRCRHASEAYKYREGSRVIRA